MFFRLRDSSEICAQTFRRLFDTNTTFNIFLFAPQSKIYSYI